MRIGVVTTSYPRHPGDPAGNFVAAHVRALRALGHEIDVIAAGDALSGERSGELSGHALSGHARSGAVRRPDGERAFDELRRGVVRIPDRSTGLFYTGGAPDRFEQRPLSSLVAGMAFSARMTAAIAARARRWDAIVAHWLLPSALAAVPTRAPLTAIAHGGDIHTLRRMRALGPVLRLLRARGARLVFVSEALRAIARDASPGLGGWLEDATIQPMGLELARFARIERAPERPPMILVLARLVAIKGVDVAIDAVAQLRSRVRLVIAGDGPERAALEHQAHRAIARASGALDVQFLGTVDATRRDQLLRAASVVVVPSRAMPSGRTEGMPLVALESLAAGVPVIASAVGGLAELGSSAALVRPDRPAELADAIDRTLAAPPAPGSLRAAVAHLDWRIVAPRLVRSE